MIDPRVGPPRFRWIDGVILAASLGLGLAAWWTGPMVLETALGLGNTQAEHEELLGLNPQMRRPAMFLSQRIARGRYAVVEFGSIVLPVATLGAALATFRHRENRSPRSLRRPGVNATAVSAILVAGLFFSEWLLRRFPRLQTGYGHNAFSNDLGQNGVCISLAATALWTVLALAGRWRPAPEWPDRLGRAICACWVGYAILAALLNYLPMP
jgi:hypothetical protein